VAIVGSNRSYGAISAAYPMTRGSRKQVAAIATAVQHASSAIVAALA
jgi:hypothetical protein